jgi:hypothetical protein
MNPQRPEEKRPFPHIIIHISPTMNIKITQRPSGSSAGSTGLSGRKMVLEIMSFFLPLACFPLADLFFRAFWAGRPSNDLPFPPVVLSLVTGGASMLITCGIIALGLTNAAYLYFSCANFSYIILFLFGWLFIISS